MTTKEQIRILSEHLTPERFAKMQYAANNRTKKLSIILEDIFQPHNAAAVMRSCDAFGVQNAYIIENRYPLKISNSVDMGTSKWMNIKRFKSATCTTAFEAKQRPPNEADAKNTKEALDFVKSQGYRIAAATLREDSIDLSDIPTDKPLAIMIGTELTGLSETAHKEADIAFKMDMLGFAQSLNLSVFSALCISTLSKKIRESNEDWKLPESERDELLLNWLRISVNSAKNILKL